MKIQSPLLKCPVLQFHKAKRKRMSLDSRKAEASRNHCPPQSAFLGPREASQPPLQGRAGGPPSGAAWRRLFSLGDTLPGFCVAETSRRAKASGQAPREEPPQDRHGAELVRFFGQIVWPRHAQFGMPSGPSIFTSGNLFYIHTRKDINYDSMDRQCPSTGNPAWTRGNAVKFYAPN